jgi:acetyl esterase
MPLWSDEFEALRPQLREESATFLASWDLPPEDPNLSQAERIALARVEREGTVHRSEAAVDRTIAGPAGPIRLRTFLPEAGAPVAAVMLHIHGGAWYMGSPEMTDLLNEMLAESLNLAVVSVDYRLAPEHPYPAGPDDCEAAAVWLLEHAEREFGSSRLLIGGESAGGHLSAVTLLRMRDRHQAIDRFVGANLVFGVFDLSHTPSQLGVGIPPGADILTSDGTLAFTEWFTPGMTRDERRAPDISPLYADLHDLPPALFTVGTHDHLRDDTLFLAPRWEAAGNRTELLVYPDTPHGCIALPSVAAHWFPHMLDFLRGCISA